MKRMVGEGILAYSAAGRKAPKCPPSPINRQLLNVIPSERGKLCFSTFSTNLLKISAQSFQQSTALYNSFTNPEVTGLFPPNELNNRR